MPALAGLTISRTAGKRARTAPAVPSSSPLTTTVTSQSSAPSASMAARQSSSSRRMRRLQMTIEAATATRCEVG